MLSICTILFVICYLVKFFLFSVCYYQIGEIKLYIYNTNLVNLTGFLCSLKYAMLIPRSFQQKRQNGQTLLCNNCAFDEANKLLLTYLFTYVG